MRMGGGIWDSWVGTGREERSEGRQPYWSSGGLCGLWSSRNFLPELDAGTWQSGRERGLRIV